jgi:hypothetical protein
MSTPQDDGQHDEDTGDGPAELDDLPPVAGGTDDSPPAQGEGDPDSW